MPNIIAVFALLALTAQAIERPHTVRIGLFTLFKPQVCEARIATGDAATLDTGGISGGHTIAPGELIRIRLAGNRLSIALSDSFGRIHKSLNATMRT